MKENELKDLLDKMTLKEKVMQLYQTDFSIFKRSVNLDSDNSGPVTGDDQGKTLARETAYNIGSILNCSTAEDAYQAQKEFLENNRLEIPLLFMFDIIHGFKTIFPIPLAMASSWDLELIEKSAKIAAKEGSASGNNVTFAPMADLVRDPRWGRVMESPGEDPLLNSEVNAAYVRGFQGDDLKDKETLVSCVKHFAAYGASEAGKEYNTVDISEHQLRNFYLSGYEGSIKAGAEMMMTAFNIFQGIPATGNKFLLRKLLRDEMGFEGVTISDYASLSEIVSHGAARDGKEAAKKAIEAGLDIEMVSTEYPDHLEELAAEAEIEEKLIDQSVLRILKLKNKLGLFEDPFRYINPEREKEAYLTKEHRSQARKAAADSMVLLKNDNLLPLSKKLKSIGILGPMADEKGLISFWKALGKNEDCVTLKEGIKNKLGNNVEINTARGCDFDSNNLDETAVQNVIDNSEVIILALGESQEMSGEGASRAYLNLPGVQKEIAEMAVQSGKDTVLVLFNGRPLELKWYDKHLTAIVDAWFPGTEGGNAAADILFGDVNPSAKLTMSFPYTVGQIPVYYNHYNTGRPVTPGNEDFRFLSRYIDIPNTPLYPFGYGLSYSEFEYSKVKLDKSELKTGNTISAAAEIKNTGQYQGKEIVQLYIQDLYGETVRPVKELKDFKKINLKPGEKKKVEFKITEEMLKYYNSENDFIVEEGEFKVFIAPNSRDLKECGNFVYKK